MSGVIKCPKCGKTFNHSSVKKVSGTTGGATLGAYIGSGLGIAGGPLGAIAGTIPGAIIGGTIGYLGSTQFAQCDCGKTFAI